jgi:hypothetical protein
MSRIGKSVLLLLIITISALISCSGSEIGNPKYDPGYPVSEKNGLFPPDLDTCTDSSANEFFFPPQTP